MKHKPNEIQQQLNTTSEIDISIWIQNLKFNSETQN